MKCYNCGMDLADNLTQCPNCGQLVNNNQVKQSQDNYTQIQSEGSQVGQVNNSNIQNNEQNQVSNNVQMMQNTMNNVPNEQLLSKAEMSMQNNQNQQTENWQQNQLWQNQLEQNQQISARNNMIQNNMGQNVVNYNGNNQNMNYQGPPKDNSKTMKYLIVGMMAVVVLILGIVCLFSFGDKSLKDGSRTIMIYMVGSNLETESKIATYDIESIDPDEIDLEKMHVLLYTGGTEKWHNDLIKNDENALFELTEDGFVKVETYEQKNMGDASTLEGFLEYGYEKYKTQHYDLIFWNHGGAIDGAIYDDFSKDNLSLEDFGKALNDSPFGDKNKLETVLFRTCLNGTIEVASVFSPYADYLVASEEVTNGGNSSVLNFLNEVETEDDGITYGKKFISAYEKQIDDIDPLGFGTMPMYAVIDLSKISEVKKLLADFIEEVDVEKNYSDIVKVRGSLYQYGFTMFDISDYDTVDLYTLVKELDKYSDESADKVLESIEEAVVYNWSRQKDSHGLSVYFPYKAKKAIRSSFLKAYKNFDDSESYYKFIGQFNSLNTSNKVSSFASSRVSDSETRITNEKEFTLQLTDEQKRDYAESIYMIFRKNDQGLYNPIYSSDNTQVGDDGLLKTNLSNNLIKLMDVTNPGFERYLTVIERTTGGEKSLSTAAVMYDFSADDATNWKSVAARVYFNVDGNEPVIGNYVNLDGENGVSGNIINPDEYKTIDFIAAGYNILDSNGNYTDEWDNNGQTNIYELDIKNIALKRASLDDNEEYYCIFKIWDIYGNVYYSNLLNIN